MMNYIKSSFGTTSDVLYSHANHTNEPFKFEIQYLMKDKAPKKHSTRKNICHLLIPP